METTTTTRNNQSKNDLTRSPLPFVARPRCDPRHTAAPFRTPYLSNRRGMRNPAAPRADPPLESYPLCANPSHTPLYHCQLPCLNATTWHPAQPVSRRRLRTRLTLLQFALGPNSAACPPLIASPSSSSSWVRARPCLSLALLIALPSPLRRLCPWPGPPAWPFARGAAVSAAPL